MIRARPITLKAILITTPTASAGNGLGLAGSSSETPQLQGKLAYEADLWGKAPFYGRPRGFVAQVTGAWQRTRYRPNLSRHPGQLSLLLVKIRLGPRGQCPPGHPAVYGPLDTARHPVHPGAAHLQQQPGRVRLYHGPVFHRSGRVLRRRRPGPGQLLAGFPGHKCCRSTEFIAGS